MLTVFYDGRCGLCDREIAFYRRHATPNSIIWRDIWQQETALLAAGLTEAQCLQKLHLLDEQGQLHTGVDAFILLWYSVPKLRVLAKLTRFAPFRSLLILGYKLFLVWYQRQSHVQACLFADKKE
ncbi:thiol-disulfide oxidoreductase DCC family protein [Oceanisphaera avium]|uniref:DUF393 domain-containing protein n=1 Tax=Oceanisphaera avium TaxID=1903694 RepID=A0A1Y0D0Z5_9GAMM|nr:DUF393 domain-containing protein [Oceanisphaera avium]ART80735.1 DUF393 domain-containing protein [Oceanisphaera avium]